MDNAKEGAFRLESLVFKICAWRKRILPPALALTAVIGGHAQAEKLAEAVDEDEMQSKMLDRTAKALMSYEVVEERADEIVSRLERSALGEYGKKVGILAPIITGKLSFKMEDFKFSYSHSSEKASVDYQLNQHWKLYVKRERESDDIEESSGVNYSYRF